MPLDPATTIAAALDAPERAKQPKKPKSGKTAKAPKKSPKAHRPARESTKTITNRLYSLWASIVRGLAGNRCEVCGRENTPSAPLNAHHIMPRQFFTGLRFDPHNGACLCPRCHKLGKYSAHKGGLWFAEWLKKNAPARYSYCILRSDYELDCKDRSKLYSEEYTLHHDYPKIVGHLPVFKVTVVRRDGYEVALLKQAYNRKAAEYLVSASVPSSDPKNTVKGILKVEKVENIADPVPQEVLDAVALDPIPVLHVNH